MKKVVLFIAGFIAFCGVANAQLEKGSTIIGADIANFKIGLDKGSASNVNINPYAAWFIKNNIALGAKINYGIQAQKGIEPTTDWGVQALGRYYVNDASINVLKHTRFFLEGTAGLAGKINAETNTSTNGFQFGVGPGMTYFVTPNIGLEGLLKYNGLVGFGSKAYTSDLTINVGFTIFLPFSKAKAAATGQQ